MIQEAADRRRKCRSARTDGWRRAAAADRATSAAVTVPVVSSGANPRAASSFDQRQHGVRLADARAMHPDERTARPLFRPRCPIVRRGGRGSSLPPARPPAEQQRRRSGRRCARPRHRGRARLRPVKPPENVVGQGLSPRRRQARARRREAASAPCVHICPAAPRARHACRIRRCAPPPYSRSGRPSARWRGGGRS